MILTDTIQYIYRIYTFCVRFVCVLHAVMNISFGAPSFSVSEGNGFVELVLTKTMGAVGPVSVNLITMNGTAG